MSTFGYSIVMASLHESFEASTTELRRVRAALRPTLIDVGEPPDDWILIATELVTNAINSGTGNQIDLAVVVDEATIELSVTNDGPSFSPLTLARIPAEQHRGRGLAIVQTIVDEFDVSHEAGRTTVRCRRRRSTP